VSDEGFRFSERTLINQYKLPRQIDGQEGWIDMVPEEDKREGEDNASCSERWLGSTSVFGMAEWKKVSMDGGAGDARYTRWALQSISRVSRAVYRGVTCLQGSA